MIAVGNGSASAREKFSNEIPGKMDARMTSSSIPQQVLSLAGKALQWVAPKLTTSHSLRDILPQISLEEVSWHDNIHDCWIVLFDRVYNITNFLIEHPGGEDVLLEYAGRDATFAFRSVNHSSRSLEAIEMYLLGKLPEHECLYKSQNK